MESNRPDASAEERAMMDLARTKRTVEEASGTHRSLVKRLKAEGHNTTALLDTIKATRKDPAVVVSEIRDTIRIHIIARIPGMNEFQTDDMDLHVVPKVSAEKQLFDAEEAGYRAGKRGDRAEDCTYPAGTEAFVRWMKHWHLGQAALAGQMGSSGDIAPPPTAERPATRGAARPAPGEGARARIAAPAAAAKQKRGKSAKPAAAKRTKRAASAGTDAPAEAAATAEDIAFH